MTNATAFVTGASRGLGEAIVRTLIQSGFSSVIAVSRSQNASLESIAAEHGANIEWVSTDLGSEEETVRNLGPVFDRYTAGSANPVVLVNNAGAIEPIAPLGTVDSREIAGNLRVNLTAPALLCNEFLRAFETTDSRRVIVNITSGLARRAMTGVASYSAAKAGLEMFTAAIALEQSRRSGDEHGAAPPVEVYAVSPGTVATDMQSALRASSESEFPDRSRFVSLYERGELYTPEYSSRRIVDFILKPKLPSGSVVHVRDL